MCEDCEPGDRACYSRNRDKQGYLVYHPEELFTPRSGESGASLGEGLESAFGMDGDGGAGY